MHMKIKTILVSQPEPKMENSPYSRLIDKEKVKVDFRPFIHVEAVDAKEVRQQKIDLKNYYCHHTDKSKRCRPFLQNCRRNAL